MTSLKKRVERLESKLLYDDADQLKATIIFTEDTGEDGQPKPITKFHAGKSEILRNPDESYKDFETRAIKEACNGISFERRDRKDIKPIPTLVANGDIQE